MEVFVLENELFAFHHVLRLKKFVKLTLQNLHYVLDSRLYFLAPVLTGLLNFLLQHKHLRHKFIVMNFCRPLHFHSSQLNHVNRSFQVVQKSSFGFVNVRWVVFHVLFQEIFNIGGVLVGVVLLLELFGLDWNVFFVDVILFGTSLVKEITCWRCWSSWPCDDRQCTRGVRSFCCSCYSWR